MRAVGVRPQQRGSLIEVLIPLMVVVRWRSALRQFLTRAIARRYRASAFGFLWAAIVPLITLAIYAFVFGTVMESRWQPAGGAEIPFAINLFAGLIVFWLMTDAVTQSPSSVIEHANLVKRALFPLEIIPVVVVGNALFHTLINTAILLAALVAFGLKLHATVLLFPLVLIPFVILLTGLAWFLAALGVYFRDLIQLVGLLMTGVLFLSPIFYAVERAPASVQTLIALNPVTAIVTASRAVLLEGTQPDWTVLGIYSVVAWVVVVLGLAFFRRARGNFADVL